MAAKDTQASVAKEFARAATASVNVALPATVQSYDKDTQKVSVKIVQSFRRKDATKKGQADEIVAYRTPIIAGVPVAWWGAGDFSFTCPLAVGDTGLLVFVDRSMDEWLATGAEETEPADTRRHDLTDAVFIPGLRSFAAAIAANGLSDDAAVLKADKLIVHCDDIKLGSSAASDAVALKSLVESELASIRSEVALHTHPVPGVTVGAGSTTSSPPVGFGTSVGNTGASKVTAE